MREIEDLNRQLADMQAENERLKKALSEQKPAQEIVNKVVARNLVIFRIGRSELSNEARANLGLLAEAIKKGSKRVNERLSKERAEAVYDCLVNEFGVSGSQLRVDHKGGVGNMFYDDPRLSRAVITVAD